MSKMAASMCISVLFLSLAGINPPLAAGNEETLQLTRAIIQVERRESIVAVAFDPRAVQQPQIAQPLCRWVTERQIEARELARERERAAQGKRLQPA